MTLPGLIEIAVFFLIVLALTKPLGTYMARVYQGERTWLDPVLRPVERLIYRVSGVDWQARSSAGRPTRSPCCSSTWSACC